jgi:DNA-3-methyladenine glycosylase II
MKRTQATRSNAASSKCVDVEAFLTRADPELGRLIAAVTRIDGRKRIEGSRASAFESLARAVVYQRMAAKAAATIFSRLRALSSKKLRPETMFEVSRQTLKATGLSDAKLLYIQNLARWFIDNPSEARRLSARRDEEIIATLTAIPGIGLWTANVFLIFALKRPDVMPANDLGIRRSVQLAYGLPRLASPSLVSEVSARWRPYRSLACVYLWNAVRLGIKRAELG